jgi:hypothetical protein
MKRVYDYSDEAIAILFRPDMTQVSRSFFDQARAFDPTLKSEEIYQAMRNVWIMNGVQLLLGVRVELTPSIFAYSLLYPYSDNILDDPALTHREKLSFSTRFELRLRAAGEMGASHGERKISELVGLIESQYPRARFPEVYASLLAIHNAQTRSLRLNSKSENLSREEILSISFDKGGASVLADGFLAAGRLSMEIQRFLFGYGIWLQLLDDIQDIPEDLSAGTQTLFAAKDQSESRMSLINRTIHFGRSVMKEISCCPADICIPFSKVIVQSVEMMLIQSIGINNRYFNSDYCEKMEYYSPVSFRYLLEAKKEGTPGRLKMITQWMNASMLNSY